MKAALTVVNEVNRLADCLSGLSQLDRVADLARDAGKSSTPQPKANVWVSPDVPHSG